MSDILAVDFGTTNTYFCKCAATELSPVGVDFGDGRDGMATAILYRTANGTNKAPLIGYTATEEYGEATEQERAGYLLRMQFKPEIASNVEARRSAVDFLKAVLDNAENDCLDIAPQSRHVIFGIPSEADQEFHTVLKAIAQEAGYGNIDMVDEPKGALLYHLHYRHIPVRDARSNLLVVDFGGGTCDFAYMQRGQVKHSWGDMQLGGRLLDDLFYQWFLETNPDAKDLLQADHAEFFTLASSCREVKEWFSRTMSHDRAESVSKTVGRYGKLVDMTWDEFLGRASSYTPSAIFKSYLSHTEDTPAPSDKAKDILGEFRHCLMDNLQKENIRPDDIHRVILAGGSSLWPFVLDIIEKELGIERKRIVRSDRPYAAIAEGLALLPALRKNFEATKGNLEKERPEFVEHLKAMIAQRFEIICEKIGEVVVHDFFDCKLRKVIVSFRENGGSVALLKEELSRAVTGSRDMIQVAVTNTIKTQMQSLPLDVKDELNQWFLEHGLASPEDDLATPQMDASSATVSSPDLFAGIDNTIERLTVAVVSMIVASICGGSGTAVIAGGPLGLAAGLVLGIVVTSSALFLGKNKTRSMAKNIPIHPRILKFLLSESKLNKIREKIYTEVVENARSQCETVQDNLTSQVETIVKQQIDALRDIDWMSR